MTWYNPGDHYENTCYFCTHMHLRPSSKKHIQYQRTPHIELSELNVNDASHVYDEPANDPIEAENDPIDFDVDMNVDASIDEVTDIASPVLMYGLSSILEQVYI